MVNAIDMSGFCAAQSEAAGEPIGGTATENIEAWLLIEHRGKWEPDIADVELPEATRSWLTDLAAKHRKLRTQLIRRSEESAKLTVFLVQTGPAAKVTRFSIGNHAEIPKLGIAAMLDPAQDQDDAPSSLPAKGSAGPDVLYLVCTHGRRDRCCARLGVALYNQMKKQGHGGELWQSSHQGGHRFAATMLYLPAGYHYGRLVPEDAESLVAAHGRGELFDIRHYRGRTNLARPLQTAEAWLREQVAMMRFWRCGAARLVDRRRRSLDRAIPYARRHAPHADGGGREPAAPCARRAAPPSRRRRPDVLLRCSPRSADRVMQPATIVARSEWADGLWTMRLDARVDFEPGQFVNLALEVDGEIVKRAYSLASAPGQHAEFYLVRVEGGALTPRLCALGVGDQVLIDPRPHGYFTLDRVPDTGALWLVSTGTGLGPFVSMLRSGRLWPRFSRVVLVNGARYVAHLGYRDELESLAAAREPLVYVPLITREDDEHVMRGRIPALIDNGFLEKAAGSPLDERCHVMLCGNPDMIVDCMATLAKRGLRKHRSRKPGHVTIERYW